MFIEFLMVEITTERDFFFFFLVKIVLNIVKNCQLVAVIC